MSDPTTILVILAMAGVTYMTRAGGLLLMTFVPASPRIEIFLHYLSGSVIVAIVVPAIVTEDAGALIGIAAVIGTMLATKNMLAAMTSGVVITALARVLTGT